MELKVILYEIKDGIATLTLNCPQRRNAWTGRMHAEYRWVLEQAEAEGVAAFLEKRPPRWSGS